MFKTNTSSVSVLKSHLKPSFWAFVASVILFWAITSPITHIANAQEIVKSNKKPYPTAKERARIREQRALERYIAKENARRQSQGLPTLEEEEKSRQATIQRNQEKIDALKMARKRVEQRKSAIVQEEQKFATNRYKGYFSNSNIYRLGKIYILSPWAPETRPGDQTALLYLTIVNPTDKEERLKNITSPQITRQIEARVSKTMGTMRGLEPVEELIIPARSSIQFNVGGMHFSMLSMLKVLKKGETFHLLFQFKNNGNGLVRAVVADKSDLNPFPIDNKIIAQIFDGTYDKRGPTEEELAEIAKKKKKEAEKNGENNKKDDKEENKEEEKA